MPSHRLPRLVLTAAVVVLAFAATSCASSAPTSAAHPTTASSTATATGATNRPAELRADMRKLWEDHITWTRLYIIAAEAGSADTDATANRLLQNQTDIGNALKPVYGDIEGNQLTALLRDHILTAGDLIAAAKAGDTAKVSAAKDKWYANADAIADFLAAANPTHWPAPEMRHMMHDHLDNTLAEAVDHLKGDYTADIADYDKVHAQILTMADMLTSGIVAQFPDKFA